jgi:hypothetical protein
MTFRGLCNLKRNGSPGCSARNWTIAGRLPKVDFVSLLSTEIAEPMEVCYSDEEAHGEIIRLATPFCGPYSPLNCSISSKLTQLPHDFPDRGSSFQMRRRINAALSRALVPDRHSCNKDVAVVCCSTRLNTSETASAW